MNWPLIGGIAVIGVVINWVILQCAANKDPNGAMGMGIMIPISLIPYSLPVLWVVGKIIELFGGGQ